MAYSISLILLGILPIDVVLHKNALTTFVNMIRYKSSIENDIALRQIVMKDESEKELLYLHQKDSKTIQSPIKISVEASWKSDIKSKPSLKYINPDSLKVCRTHHMWTTVRRGIYDSRRAQLKCKILTGTYHLQGNRAAFNQYQVNATSRLCS